MLAAELSAGLVTTTMLIDIASCEELFHTAAGPAFADIVVDGHRETWPIRSKRFRGWLRRRYHQATGAWRVPRRFAQRSICSRHGRNSTDRNEPSTSAPPGMTAISISISLMSTGAPSTSDLTDGA